MKLIPMTDFVLEQEITPGLNEKNFINVELLTLEKIRNYANFLRQPLELWMFVPCWFDGGKWLPFDESKLFDYTDKGKKYWIVGSETFEYKEYQKAKERVLFEGFKATSCNEYYVVEYINEQVPFWYSWNDSKTVENSLIRENSDIQLTQEAIKQIGL